MNINDMTITWAVVERYFTKFNANMELDSTDQVRWGGCFTEDCCRTAMGIDTVVCF